MTLPEHNNESPESVKTAHDYLLTLGAISVAFAGVERATHYPHGRPENDAEHSFHLGLSAVEMAATYYPHLNTGLVAQFAYVHDLPEVYAGDTPTFGITQEARSEKERLEKAATERLLNELPPHTAQLLARYEDQIEPEAIFGRFIDKLLPAIVHASAPDANRDIFKKTFNLSSLEELEASREARTAVLKAMCPEEDLKFIHRVSDLVSETSRNRIFS